jgi:hypothetical protein
MEIFPSLMISSMINIPLSHPLTLPKFIPPTFSSTQFPSPYSTSDRPQVRELTNPASPSRIPSPRDPSSLADTTEDAIGERSPAWWEQSQDGGPWRSLGKVGPSLGGMSSSVYPPLLLHHQLSSSRWVTTGHQRTQGHPRLDIKHPVEAGLSSY